MIAVALLAVLSGCSASVHVRDADEDVVRARRFELVDAQGRVRAEIAIDDDGAAGLFVRDDAGRLRASVSYDEAQSAMYLWDANGHIRVGAALYSHGGAGVAVHGEENKGGAVMYYKDRGTLTFYGEDGTVLHREPPAKPQE